LERRKPKKKGKENDKRRKRTWKTRSTVSERRRDSGSTGSMEEGNQNCWDMGEIK
jgi:hypothetical protein